MGNISSLYGVNKQCRSNERNPARPRITLFSHRGPGAPPKNSTSTKRVVFLPTELIVQILYHTDPRDVVRWRTVSKRFCAITHDPILWKVLYTMSSLIRPSGPFPSQSAASLEYMLMRSTQLARSWATQPLSRVSRTRIPFKGRLAHKINLVDGRWLIACQENRRFVLYETLADAEKHPPQILWDQEEKIACWDKCAVVSEGQWVVYVLLSEKDSQRWRLLELRLDGGTGMLHNAVALDVPKTGPDVVLPQMLHGGQSRFLFFKPLQLVFDTQTCIFYEFPEFHVALDEIRRKFHYGNPILGKHTVLTNTHVFRCFEELGKGVLIQAFTVPDDDDPLTAEKRKHTLRLSHEGLFSSDPPYVPIRNSIVDPTTGAISVKLLSQWCYSDGGHPCCIDMTLPKASSVEVVPITIRSQAVVTQWNQPLCRDFMLDFNVDFLTSTGDGRARGLIPFPPDDPDDLYYNPPEAVAKFTIDAVGDRCVATMGGVCRLPPEWRFYNNTRDPDNPLESSYYMHFDGVRGRLYFSLKVRETWMLVVVDVG